LVPAAPLSGGNDGALLLWDSTLFGVIVLHWALMLALVCFIVRVMKGRRTRPMPTLCQMTTVRR
jgi:hypothetical protein